METILDDPLGPLNNNNSKAGRVFGIAGFVISIIALVLWIFVSGFAVLAAVAGGGMGLAILWVIVSLLGTGLSVAGIIKAKAGNGKKGLANAGLVIGIIATLLSIRTVFGVKAVHDTSGDITKLMEQMKTDNDSLNDTVKIKKKKVKPVLPPH